MIRNLLLVASFIAFEAGAQDEETDWFDNLDDLTAEAVEPESPWFGSLNIDSQWSTDDGDLTRQEWSLILGGEHQWKDSGKLKGSVRLQHDTLRWFESKDDIDYDEREQNLEIYEAYYSNNLNSSNKVKLGRQKLGLGISQAFRILDSFSPIDARLPLYNDLNLIKLPQWALNYENIGENRNERLFVFLENRSDQVYYDGDFALPKVELARSISKGVGWLFSHEQTWNEIDFKLVLADTVNPALQMDSENQFYQQERWVGASVRYVINEYLLYTEMRKTDKVEVVTPMAGDRGVGYSQHLIGMSYLGIQHLTVYAEYLWQDTNDYESEQYLLSASYFMLRDKLQLNWQHVEVVDMDATFDRFYVDYSLSDGLNIKAGFLNYNVDSSSGISHYDRNDRFYLALSFFW